MRDRRVGSWKLYAKKQYDELPDDIKNDWGSFRREVMGE